MAEGAAAEGAAAEGVTGEGVTGESGTQPVSKPSVDAATAAYLQSLPPGTTFVRRVRGPRRWPGIVSCVLAVLMLAATGAGIQIAARGDFALSTGLAYAAIGLSIAAVVLGVVAIFGRFARGAGVVGVLVAVLGNPLVLIYVLNFLSGK